MIENSKPLDLEPLKVAYPHHPWIPALIAEVERLRGETETLAEIVEAMARDNERLREQVEFYEQVIATHYILPVQKFNELAESVQTAINSRWHLP